MNSDDLVALNYLIIFSIAVIYIIYTFPYVHKTSGYKL